MRIASNKPAAATQKRPATPAPAAKKETAAAKKPEAWGASANVGRDVRDTLKSQAGRMLFAELLENHMATEPGGSDGYQWDPADTKALQWTLFATQHPDDTMLVRVSGKELSIVNESNGFEGKATFKGATREALNEAVLKAMASYNRAADAARVP